MSSHLRRADGSPDYLSYLLRLWQTQSGGAPVWRASLENPLTQEILRFDSLPDLFAFLRAAIGQGDQDDGGDGERPAAIAP
jgi:hypothetical protein